MRLSEAIRLGAMLHPQCFTEWRVRNADFEIVATCALGAAGAAGYFDSHAMPTWPSVCPVCGFSANVPSLITHLNDRHRWTREQIADWVATVEPADEPCAPPEPLAAVDPQVKVLESSLRA